jgi:hypothetical protein
VLDDRAAARAASPPAQRINTASNDVAGGLLALFLYPIGLNLVLGGPSQAAGWIRAKFINEPFGKPVAARGGTGAGGKTGTTQKKGTTTAGGRG